MRKPKRVQIGPITGHGPTMADAIANASDKLREAVDQPWSIHIIRRPEYRTHFAIVARIGLDTWTHTIVDAENMPVNSSRLWSGNCHQSEHEAIKCARLGMAQVACDIHDDTKSGLEFLTNEPAMRDHLSWLAWQRTYSRHMAAGMTDMQARQQGTDYATVASLKARWL